MRTTIRQKHQNNSIDTTTSLLTSADFMRHKYHKYFAMPRTFSAWPRRPLRLCGDIPACKPPRRRGRRGCAELVENEVDACVCGLNHGWFDAEDVCDPLGRKDLSGSAVGDDAATI